MKKVKLSKREIETMLWLIEDHKEEVVKKLKAEKDIVKYRLLFDYNMHLRDLANKLDRVIKSVPGIPVKTKPDGFIREFYETDNNAI
ncbi:MAG: hypothetical protein GX892_13470 [Thermoanaerobacteraceae bacterium]|nr:hypothetical protein [Thermoanaerobacteraceae bacterium]